MLRLLPAVLMAGMFGGGCAAVHDVEPITVTVERARVTETGPAGARVEVDLAAQNPNAVPLPLTDSTYRLTLEDGRRFSGTQRPLVTVPAKGRVAWSLPAIFEGEVEGLAYRVKGNVTYEPPGEIRLILTETRVPLPTASITGRGTVVMDAGGPAQGER